MWQLIENGIVLKAPNGSTVSLNKTVWEKSKGMLAEWEDVKVADDAPAKMTDGISVNPPPASGV